MSETVVAPKSVDGRSFYLDNKLQARLRDFDANIRDLWSTQRLTKPTLQSAYLRAKVQAVYHSNRIEGNCLSLAETARIVSDGIGIPGKPWKDQLEARNLATVLEYALEIGMDHATAITQNEIRRMHALLLRDIDAESGRYRKAAVQISGSKFMPPPAFQVAQHMMELSDYVRSIADPGQEQTETPLLQAALAHVLFGQIHPFVDGNGRTARALMNLVLLRRGYPTCIIREESRDSYIAALESAGQCADITAFTQLVYESVAESDFGA